MNFQKAPFPYFGGKSKAAELVWSLLGDVPHYVEPFAGSMAVLLNRPHLANRPYFSETVNDVDGLLVNAWRSIQLSPDATADAASNPVAEADLHARHLALVRWREEHQLEHLMGDPAWHDPVMAGWWMWGLSCWIGSGWCSGAGPWTTDDDDRLVMQGRAVREPGVNRQLPHLGDDGQGVNRPQLREPGVGRQRPHLGDDGQGVNTAAVREPGVGRQLPHLTGGGQGVNRPQLREPGVNRQLPHLGDDGQGVNRPQLREPGVGRQRPHLGDDGQGVNTAAVREPGTEDDMVWHPVTMPLLVDWFGWLSARLRHVRIINGDWTRACTTGASQTLPVRQGHGPAGVFLDPPYADTASRVDGLYARDSLVVAHDVREWCLANGDDPRYRIVLAGFEDEHDIGDTDALVDAGWTSHEWFTAGFLSGGMGNTGKDGHQQKRERIWSSPHCVTPSTTTQLGMFGE